MGGGVRKGKTYGLEKRPWRIIHVFDQAKATEDKNDDKEKWYGQFTGGLGLFGEYLLIPKFSLGLELMIAFPYVREVKTGDSDKEVCVHCEQNILVRLLLRVKVPLNIKSAASFYPLMLFGYSDYISRFEDEEALNFHGIGFGVGLGAEVYFSKVTEFFEMRYMLDSGWEDKVSLLNHNLSLIIGLKIGKKEKLLESSVISTELLARPTFKPPPTKAGSSAYSLMPN